MHSAVTHGAFLAARSKPRRATQSIKGRRAKESRTEPFARRRPGRSQGIAIEMLGHAIEYLIDSRMFLIETPYAKSEEDAIQMLMKLNRSVFESCPEVLPTGVRVRNWMSHLIGGAGA